ncbi:hypothetical protein [Paenibacillus sp. LHD-38]|uniref:hypothetical protein n=1 Tax=Paenibacillus sp. LHD-38 TaxID=3072143 RepID=UPI00280EB9ED|nr:hypothetical protein [Paenibacillus sp. LHD-38]MDQ8733234.1 hypothetical protein [Paenibacillus sp. LHD-38]
MNIATGVNMLPISAVMMGRMETIYPTLIWDKTRLEAALIILLLTLRSSRYAEALSSSEHLGIRPDI